MSWRRTRAALTLGCLTLMAFEPTVADDCDVGTTEPVAVVAASPESGGADARQDGHALHVCHCSHLHLGLVRRQADPLGGVAMPSGAVRGPEHDLRSGPAAQPPLRPPLRR